MMLKTDVDNRLVDALQGIAGGDRLLPILRCQERSTGELCARPANYVAYAGVGYVVVCDRCMRFYADSHKIELPADLDVVVGNLRDQARNALELLQH